MGVVDDLARAREAYERRDWMSAYDALSVTDPALLKAEDFARLAQAAQLLGRRNDSVQAMQRAYQVNLDSGDELAAARCAFWLAMLLTEAGEPAVAGGWHARAERLLAGRGEDLVEHGYLACHALLAHVDAGEFGAALEQAQVVADFGRRFREPDLLAMGVSAEGSLRMYAGQVVEGVALLDEAMICVAAGELTPVVAGLVYCMMIEACQGISDFGRVAEWTTALTAWCDEQPELVLFTGQCAVHRGQLLRVQGAWAEALDEFERAIARYLEADTPAAAGLALAERGDVLRVMGDLDAAEACYAEAGRRGFEPQTGLALLRLAQGRIEAAVAVVRRLLAEPLDPVHRSQLLPAAVEVLLAGEAVDEAGACADELEELAAGFGIAALRAAAGHAAAAVALALGDGATALARVRPALRTWRRYGAAYDVARGLVLVGLAYRELGDEESAATELTEARTAFAGLGARPAEAVVARLLDGRGAPGGLTAREVEVLRLVAAGRSNPEIAAELVVSDKTVARHLSNIFAKLDVSSRTAAAAYAFKQHLV